MIIDLYGKEIEVIRNNNRWQVFILGTEGKKRPAKDIAIPSTITESELVDYLADIYHESANWKNPEVKVIG